MARERPTHPSVSQDLAVQAVGAKGRPHRAAARCRLGWTPPHGSGRAPPCPVVSAASLTTDVPPSVVPNDPLSWLPK